jgi:hypothetical protein
MARANNVYGDPWERCVIGDNVKESVVNIANVVQTFSVTVEEVVTALEKAVKGARENLRKRLVAQVDRSRELSVEAFNAKYKLKLAKNENMRLSNIIIENGNRRSYVPNVATLSDEEDNPPKVS